VFVNRGMTCIPKFRRHNLSRNDKMFKDFAEESYLLQINIWFTSVPSFFQEALLKLIFSKSKQYKRRLKKNLNNNRHILPRLIVTLFFNKFFVCSCLEIYSGKIRYSINILTSVMNTGGKERHYIWAREWIILTLCQAPSFFVCVNSISSV